MFQKVNACGRFSKDPALPPETAWGLRQGQGEAISDYSFWVYPAAAGCTSLLLPTWPVLGFSYFILFLLPCFIPHLLSSHTHITSKSFSGFWVICPGRVADWFGLWLGHQDLLELWISSIVQLKSGTVTLTPLICSLQEEEIHQNMFRIPAYSYNQDTAKMPRAGPGPAQPHHYSHGCYHLLQGARALNYLLVGKVYPRLACAKAFWENINCPLGIRGCPGVGARKGSSQHSCPVHRTA